jgi:hypothetical protein
MGLEAKGQRALLGQPIKHWRLLTLRMFGVDPWVRLAFETASQVEHSKATLLVPLSSAITSSGGIQ